MSRILSLFFTIFFFNVFTQAFAEEDYFAPLIEEERNALEVIMNDIGYQLSDVLIYKTDSKLKTVEHKIRSKLLVRKQTNGTYTWEKPKSKYEYLKINGTAKKPNIVINQKGNIISINIEYAKKPLEKSYQLSHFKELLALGFFFLDDCNDKTVESLPKLEKLKELYLLCRSNIRFPDLTLFSNLTYLRLHATDLKQIDITRKNSLERLYISVRENAKNLSELKNLTHLEFLKLHASKTAENAIIDLDWLAPMTKLKELSLNGHSIVKSFFSLNQLKNLENLNIILHSIEALPELSELNNLESIKLQMHQLKSLPSLKHMTKLKTLDIQETKLSNLNFIKDNHSLISFSIFQSPVQSIKPLKNLINLEKLELRRTNIKRIEGFEKLSKLKELDITESLIKKIEGLDQLDSLEKLNLSRQTIDKIENLDNLKNLKDFYMPKFKKTKENYEYLKALEKRGVLLI